MTVCGQYEEYDDFGIKTAVVRLGTEEESRSIGFAGDPSDMRFLEHFYLSFTPHLAVAEALIILNS